MITLDMIEQIENEYGGLHQIAENLLNNSLPHSVIEDILNFIGCNNNEIANEEILTNVLLDTLEPLDTLGAICLGEELPVLEKQLM